MFPPAAMRRNHLPLSVWSWLASREDGRIAACCARAIAGHETIIISHTLAVTVFSSVLFRGFHGDHSDLIGVLAGYARFNKIHALGVDTAPIARGRTGFALPTFYTRFEWFAILTILPAALVVTSPSMSVIWW